MTGVLFATGLLSGCVSPSGDYCDIANPIYLSGVQTVDWLIHNDEPVLRDIVTHNEQVERLCG